MYPRPFLVLALAIVLALNSEAWAQVSPLNSEFAVEKRRALVIGNGAYQVGRLNNPTNDARDISQALQLTGFDVTLIIDSDRDSMLRAIIDFRIQLQDGSVGLFYYAGHALQVDGQNYMVPIGAKIAHEDYVQVEAIDINQVLQRMGATDNRLNIVVLDACRDNPFARRWRSGARGLAAQTQTPSGTFIAYATSPGDVADDGRGRNSPFSAALVEALARPGLPLEEVFKVVAREVRAQTDGRQEPWTASSITENFYFRPPASDAATTAGGEAEVMELALWEAVKDSAAAEDLEVYLRRFPTGRFAALAHARRENLRKPQQPAQQAVVAPQPQPNVAQTQAQLEAWARTRAAETGNQPTSQLFPGTSAWNFRVECDDNVWFTVRSSPEGRRLRYSDSKTPFRYELKLNPLGTEEYALSGVVTFKDGVSHSVSLLMRNDQGKLSGDGQLKSRQCSLSGTVNPKNPSL